MVKLAIRPQHRIVTLFASRREARVRHRRRRIVVVRLVTGNARRNRNVVVIVDMARGARRLPVR